tara:strand:- start:56029 stop:57063 length:1035 start_codon:yes stop_codon:yes gene_type:complete
MPKRGQITTFAIIGIIILAVAILVVVINTADDVISDTSDLGEAQPISEFTQDCLEQATKNGIIAISRQGGYYNPPLESSIIFFDDYLPYFYEEKEYKIITKEKAQLELEQYLEEKIPLCTDSYTNFVEQGFTISSGNPKATVNFNQKAHVDLRYPITIKKDLEVITIDKYSYTVNLDIDKFLLATKELVDLQVKHNGYICLTCLQEINKEYNVEIDVLPIYDPTYFNNDIIWYRLSDPENEFIGSEPFTFEFITEYFNASSPEPKFEIEEIPDLTVKTGDEVDFEVMANKDATFTSTSDLFQITPEGKIKFIAEVEYTGTNLVLVSGKDSLGQEDQEIFKVIIE